MLIAFLRICLDGFLASGTSISASVDVRGLDRQHVRSMSERT